MQKTISILSFIVFLFFFSFSANASRGISVQLKNGSGEKSQNVQLYKGSYALLVGESNYTNGWPSLESIPDELSQVESLLTEKGFRVEKYLDPKSEQLEDVFSDFIDKYGYEPENRLLFYYAGHGYTRKEGEKGYLVPSDAPNPLKDERGFIRKSLNMNQLVSWARDIEAKHALFLFDSCFSGTIFKQRDLPKPSKYITSLTTQPVRLFITAGKAGETVPARSTFTPVFIDGLEHGLADLNGDGYVSGTELGLYLQDNVPKYTDQSPQFGKIRDYKLSRGDFIFLAGGNPTIVTDAVPDYGVGQQKGVLKVTSTPSGAAIRINGKTAGETPVELGNMTPGEVNISVSKSGYIAQNRMAEIHAGRRKVVGFDLVSEKKSGWLTIRPDPKSATVRIVNIVPKYRPGMELEAGKYQVEVSAEGYITEKKTITLAAGDDISVAINLEQVKRLSTPSVTSTVTPAHFSSGGSTYTDPVTGMEFVFVKGGCYQMGDTFGDVQSDEKPVHEVCVDDFYMGKYEVTQGEYTKIMGSNPSYFTKGDRYPVETVSWSDAWEFIRKLKSRTGKTFKLPTEAEWEYAARSGGKKEEYAGANSPDNVAWYRSNSGYLKHQVGTKQPNGLGIYDMNGNVWEWCSDWYSKTYYSSSPRNNPQGPSGGDERVIRGGSWDGLPANVRAANRSRIEPGNRRKFLGFRLVLPGPME